MFEPDCLLACTLCVITSIKFNAAWIAASPIVDGLLRLCVAATNVCHAQRAAVTVPMRLCNASMSLTPAPALPFLDDRYLVLTVRFWIRPLRPASSADPGCSSKAVISSTDKLDDPTPSSESSPTGSDTGPKLRRRSTVAIAKTWGVREVTSFVHP